MDGVVTNAGHTDVPMVPALLSSEIWLAWRNHRTKAVLSISGFRLSGGCRMNNLTNRTIADILYRGKGRS